MTAPSSPAPRLAVGLLAGLAACGVEPEAPTVDVDLHVGLVEVALDAARPEPLVSLVDAPAEALGLEAGLAAGCPTVEVVAVDADGPSLVRHERWHGGCLLPDGATLRGQLDVVHTPAVSRISTESFSARKDGAVRFSVSGSVEVEERGGVLLVGAAASLCGGGGPGCDLGPARMDLSFTLLPPEAGGADYPDAYDGVVSGAVLVADEWVSVDGSWSIDTASCAIEPASGSFSLQADAAYALDGDGARACDGCYAWTIEGLPAPAWCGGD
jgi:hypothetical protein